jgi:hypothetical protein
VNKLTYVRAIMLQTVARFRSDSAGRAPLATTTKPLRRTRADTEMT